jgi:hypothetical protein
MFEELLWISVVISIITSVIRASNIGFQKFSYILTSFGMLFITYDAFCNGSAQAFVLQVFYLLISLFGVYRWSGNNVNIDESTDENEEVHEKEE